MGLDSTYEGLKRSGYRDIWHYYQYRQRYAERVLTVNGILNLLTYPAPEPLAVYRGAGYWEAGAILQEVDNGNGEIVYGFPMSTSLDDSIARIFCARRDIYNSDDCLYAQVLLSILIPEGYPVLYLPYPTLATVEGEEEVLLAPTTVLRVIDYEDYIDYDNQVLDRDILVGVEGYEEDALPPDSWDWEWLDSLAQKLSL